MKLLLTSAGLQNKKVADFFVSILPKKPVDCSVLMIAYAQSDEELFYTDESRKELVSLGIQNVFFFNLKKSIFSIHDQFDIIYICGGNTFSILARIRSTGIEKFIARSVKNNNSVYVGVSAGSIIAGPNIEIAAFGSEGDENGVGLSDLTGFQFTNISVFPHFKAHLKEEVEAFKKQVDFPIITLTDEQAFYINDSTEQIIE